jgi:hypothetical protein
MSQEEPSKDSTARTSPASTACKPATSERRTQANRENSLRSTGPKTDRRKRTVARNAIKHGILAREVVITAGEGEESLEEFGALVQQFFEYYKPLGIVEELLVQTIATCCWRKARVIRAENGEIRKRLDTSKMDRALQISDKANLDMALSDMNSPLFRDNNCADQQVSTKDQWSARQVAQSGLREHDLGVVHLAALLLIAKSEMASDGYISEYIRKEIFDAFHFWDYELAIACFNAGRKETKTEDQRSENVLNQTGDQRSELHLHQKNVAALIDGGLAALEMLSAYSSKRRALALDAEARSCCLPPADVTDKLLRYEAHFDKQLYRAMDQLERLQRRRRGENVLRPLNINLGRGR